MLPNCQGINEIIPIFFLQSMDNPRGLQSYITREPEENHNIKL